MKIFQLINKYSGAIIAFMAAIILAVCAASWMGFDFRLVDRSLIGDKSDSVANSWAIYQATDNLLHRPTNLGYSTIFYGTKASFASTIAPYGIAVFILPFYFLSGW